MFKLPNTRFIMANLDPPIYGAIGISFCTEIQLSNRYLTDHLPNLLPKHQHPSPLPRQPNLRSTSNDQLRLQELWSRTAQQAEQGVMFYFWGMDAGKLILWS